MASQSLSIKGIVRLRPREFGCHPADKNRWGDIRLKIAATFGERGRSFYYRSATLVICTTFATGFSTD